MNGGWALSFLYLLVAGAIFVVARESRCQQARKPGAGALTALLAAALWPF